jgi:hypothetical protein
MDTKDLLDRVERLYTPILLDVMDSLGIERGESAEGVFQRYGRF